MKSMVQWRLLVQRVDQFCVFDLYCDSPQLGRGVNPTIPRLIKAKVPYDATLTELYQDWQSIFQRRYRSTLRARIAKKGQRKGKQESAAELWNDTFNWDEDLRVAEQALLDQFNLWLRADALFPIQDALRKALYDVERVHGNSPTANGDRTLDLLIGCDDLELTRLPWEGWMLTSTDQAVSHLRIGRTLFNPATAEAAKPQPTRRTKPRILAIFADAPDLPNLETDKVALQSLKSLTHVTIWQAQLDPTLPDFQAQSDNLRTRAANLINDERGWDGLIFAGHSKESTVGGTLELAPNVSLSLGEIEDVLNQARGRGLQLAMFISCEGLAIAQFLMERGLNQVLVMRERIPDVVAPEYFRQLCQCLAQHLDIHQATLNAQHYLKSTTANGKGLSYPSTYLLPSLFCRPGAPLFRIERSRLWKIAQLWMPTWGEAVAITAIACLSILDPVQDVLLDARIWAQAVYRDQTDQLGCGAPDQLPCDAPPVLLVAIDQPSIRQGIEDRAAAIQRNEVLPDGEPLPVFEFKPMDRIYLADLVTQLTQRGVRAIGTTYFLDTQEPGEAILRQAWQDALQSGIWTVLSVNQVDGWGTSPAVAPLDRVLQGSASRPKHGRLKFPDEPTCPPLLPCPTSYWLALAYLLNQPPTEEQDLNPAVTGVPDFQFRLNRYLESLPDDAVVAPLTVTPPPWGLDAIVDFSIPYNQVYRHVPAMNLANELTSDAASSPPVALIASGGYRDADDRKPMPMAVGYWCQQADIEDDASVDRCLNTNFADGQAHAYMVHHFLSRHRVILTPTLWMVGISIIVSKGMAIMVLNQPYPVRRRILSPGLAGTLVYGLVVLQLFVTFNVLLPWLLPSGLVWIYLLRATSGKSR